MEVRTIGLQSISKPSLCPKYVSALCVCCLLCVVNRRVPQIGFGVRQVSVRVGKVMKEASGCTFVVFSFCFSVVSLEVEYIEYAHVRRRYQTDVNSSNTASQIQQSQDAYATDMVLDGEQT